jgi:hypothetical protein
MSPGERDIAAALRDQETPTVRVPVQPERQLDPECEGYEEPDRFDFDDSGRRET